MTLLAVERIKLFSTRSPWWCAIVALGITVGFAALVTGTTESAEYVSVASTQFGYMFGLMVVMVMAALAITTEYRFGTIRSTFQAIPSRSSVLLAKATVLALLAGAIGEIAAFGSWALAKLMKPGADLAINTATEWRNVAGVGLVYAIGAVIAVAIGSLIRQTAGAVSIMLVWSLLVESLIGLIPRIGDDIQRWMPFAAAGHFLQGGGAPTADGPPTVANMPFGPWGGLAYFAGIAAVLLVFALVVTERRDA